MSSERDTARRADFMMIAVLGVICALLAVRALVGTSVGEGDVARTVHGFGVAYVEEVPAAAEAVPGAGDTASAVPPAAPTWRESSASAWAAAEAADPGQRRIVLDWPRTVGIWFAAVMTLAVFSFLWRDNPLYKVAEHLVVGVSAGYWMVVALWDTLVPKLFASLLPDLVRANFMPSLTTGDRDWFALVPLGLGMLLLCRLSSRLSWLGVFPLAFVVGTFSGLKFVQFVESDLVAQVATMFDPLAVTKLAADGTVDLPASVGASIGAVLVLVGVLCVLAYFFFSLEHRGALGAGAKVGVWYLMITFGASFGFTVMGRIALLAARVEFLFDDWLWLIDPAGKH